VPRWAAISLVMLALVGVVGGIVGLLIPPAARQLDTLLHHGREYLDHITHARWYPLFDQWLNINALMDRLRAYVQRQPAELAGRALSIAKHLVEITAALATVLFLTLFMLIYGEGLVSWCVEQARVQHRPQLRRALGRAHDTLGAYLRGLGLLCFTNAALAGVYLAVVGVPFYLPLGLFSGLASVVPLAGAVVAGTLISLVAALTKGFWWGVGTAIYYIVYQELENHVLAPLVYKRAVRLNPLVSLIFALMFAELAGIAGAVLAVPCVAVARILLGELLELRAQRPDDGSVLA